MSLKANELYALMWKFDVLKNQIEDKKKELSNLETALENCSSEMDVLKKELEDDKSVQ